MSDAQLLVSIEGLAKRFGSTQALSDASFTVRRGEVHALVGENGSGKSTLVKVLSGVHRPDAGTLAIDGAELAFPRSPREARDTGIATVFQEVLSVEARTVLENVWLGNERPTRRVPLAERRRRAQALLERLLASPPPLDALAEELSLSDRQALGIVRSIVSQPKVLVLDEATSALDYDTRKRLFAFIRELAQQGLGVVIITHRMDEIDEIGDRITVMRSGRTVGSLERGEWSDEVLVRMMTGSENLVQERPIDRLPADERMGDAIAEIRGLRLAAGARPTDADIRRGEIIGVAGLEGQGQDAFVKSLAGLVKREGEIVSIVDGVRTPVRTAHAAAGQGIVYVARDRRGESIFEWMSIRENFSVATLGADATLGVIRAGRTRARLADYVERLSIRMGDPELPITTLSGGNQQKVIIARWLATRPRLLVLNDPTRGIDVNAKRDLYRLLGQLALDGVSVVMLSTEVDEHVELMDRVWVFRDNELLCEVAGDDLDRETLVASFFGNAPGMEKTA